MLTVALALVFTVSARADSYYYGAVNYQLFPCSESYMPVNLATGVVIPSRLLIEGNLGIRASYDTVNRVYTISDTRYSITFDIGKNKTYDSRQQYNELAFEASGIIYLPLDFICRQFELTYKYIGSDYGTILRIYYKNLVTTDNQFLAVNGAQLSRQESRYREINGLPQTSVPGQPQVSSPPSPVPVPTPPPQVTLSIDVENAEYLGEVLEVLERYNQQAAFFMTRAAMEQDHMLLRRVAGRYTVGILAGDFDSAAGVADDLDSANRILRQATLTQTRFVRVPGAGGLPEDVYQTLADIGYLPCDWTVGADQYDNPEKAAYELIERLEDGENVIRLVCADNTPDVLEHLMRGLAEENAVFLGVSITS